MTAQIPLPPFLGLRSMLRLALLPLGYRVTRHERKLNTPERLNEGLVAIFPGIEGCSTVSESIARGLHVANIPYAVQIRDWRPTSPWSPWHMTCYARNRAEAREIARTIEDYQLRYPGRPVHLIGHSGGAGMALFALSELDPAHRVDTTILLAGAVSREFDFQTAGARTKRGIWNFWSFADFPALCFGTLIFGTMDRKHAISIGAIGMGACKRSQTGESILRDLKFSPCMMRSWNFAGHFGCTNAAFVRRYIAPIIRPHTVAESTTSSVSRSACNKLDVLVRPAPGQRHPGAIAESGRLASESSSAGAGKCSLA